jgi:hypothetical protein
MECAVMVKIKFKRAWRGYRTGQVVELPGGITTQLLAQRVAVEDSQPSLIETAAIEHDAETADATPKRSRRRAVSKPDSPDIASR